ncbi:hypothetical protein [Lactococcus lactis]|uniref:Uncharacterized protein n=1 Tax=Lactococcus lactis TaxID=1358 RepID=A0AAP3Z2U2_9LACT|nr:hypothetical protein [Lactococcus lactis]MDG4977320.1 hypothetical protein [Lactococcus lactis]
MNFFSTTESRYYFSNQKSKMQSEINSLDDNEIVNCNFEEWKEYLYSKYSVAPITLFEESIEKSFSEKKIKKYNHFHRFNHHEPEYYNIAGYCITFKIYYDGDPDLFELKPSSFILDRFSSIEFQRPFNDKCGYFTLEREYTKEELLTDKSESSPEMVQNQFENYFKNYREMIKNVNKEVEIFNSSLKEQAEQMLTKRKEKASTFALLSQKLEIPINLSTNAPNITPIPLIKISRTPPKKPITKHNSMEYLINDIDYKNINKIITMSGTTMEKTARTYYLNNEEELRDHLLATLNTHYENATGETFRKIGKTDILIEFENRAAFIGECKIWHGITQFNEAIQQLCNYSTWRDGKVSLVVFNKKNKNFQGILKAVKDWIDSSTKSYSMVLPNVWQCKFYRSDMQVEIDLNIAVFDLYVDESQFKDIRKNNI